MTNPSCDSKTSVALEACGLRFVYGRHTALDGVDLTFGRGVHGVLGPNGAGKTTLLRLLSTAAVPESGVVRIVGKDPWRDRNLQSVRAWIGYLPQRLGFYPRHTVAEFVRLVTLLKAVPTREARRDEVARVLEVVDLGDRAGQKIGTLSGGMRQRLGLACALVGDPPVIIMDEPTVGLDPEQRSMFRELISHIGVEHTVVISTHQTEDVSALCRRVYVILDGRVVWSGATADLIEQARGRVWESPSKEGQLSSWISANGKWRNLGAPARDSVLLEPNVEDGYLVALAEAR